MFKTANVGSTDRLIRIIVGLLLIALPFMTQLTLWNNKLFKFGAPVVGIILVVTALIRFCPLYRIFGASTCKTAK